MHFCQLNLFVWYIDLLAVDVNTSVMFITLVLNAYNIYPLVTKYDRKSHF